MRLVSSEPQTLCVHFSDSCVHFLPLFQCLRSVFKRERSLLPLLGKFLLHKTVDYDMIKVPTNSQVNMFLLRQIICGGSVFILIKTLCSFSAIPDSFGEAR